MNDPEIDNYSLYKLSTEVTKIFELINSNIELLSKLGQQLNGLDSEIVDLLLEVEKSNHTEDYYKSTVRKIKFKIDDYSQFLKEANSTLTSNNSEIDEFLEKCIFMEGVSVTVWK